MSFNRIGDRGLLISAGNPIRTLSFAAPEFPALQNGRLWAGLSGNLDYEREHLFMDVMKSAREWIGHLPSSWGGGNAYLPAVQDANGYPQSMPAELQAYSTLVLVEQPTEGAAITNGRYRFLYDGAGTITINGVSGVSSSAGQIEFDYAATGSNTVEIRVSAVTPGNHPRNFRLFRTSYADRVAAGFITRPGYEWGALGLLRFMDLQRINHIPPGTWAGRPTPSYYTWATRGIPVETIVQAANELGIKPWVCIPHLADDTYVTNFVTYIRDNLNPALKCYIEWSNEIWNFQFPQTTWCIAQAVALFGGSGTDDGKWCQYAGGRASQCMDIVASVFSGQMSRIARVLGVQTGWEGLEQYLLDAPMWVAIGGGRHTPYTSFDAYGVTGYFDGGVNNGSVAEDLLDIVDADGYEAGEAFVLDRLNGPESTSGSIAQLIGHFEYHRGVCNTRGLDLVMYEGGTHIVPTGDMTGNADLAAFMIEFNYSEAIGVVYRNLLIAWDEIGDGPFNHFQTIIRPTQYGCWGAMRWAGDSTSRSEVLLEYNEAPLEPLPDIEPLPLNSKLIVTGHSIPDATVKGPMAAAISAMGGSADITTGTGPYASAEWRWNNDPAGPTQVKAALQAPGAAYDLFLGIEAHGGSYGSPGRASVAAQLDTYGGPPPAAGYDFGVRWHNAAAATGAQPFYANFWRNDSAQLYGSSWRASLNDEAPLWDGLIDYINANRNPGTPAMRLVPWLQVWMAIYDAIQAGTVTGVTMAQFFNDDVHIETSYGRWCQIATSLAVMYRRHPDELPANAGASANISAPLAAQLRPVIWAACLSNPRTGLAP